MLWLQQDNAVNARADKIGAQILIAINLFVFGFIERRIDASVALLER